MKTNTIFENLLLSMYEKSLNENGEVDDISKKISDLRAELKKMKGDTGDSATSKRATINSEIDKLVNDKKEAQKNSEDSKGPTGSTDSKEGATGSTDSKEGSTDSKGGPTGSTDSKEGPTGSTDSKEGATGSTDSKEGATGSTDSKEGSTGSKEGATGPTSKKGTKEDEGDAEMKSKNKEAIEKLDAQIKSLEKTYDDKKESTTELINASKETTDKLASSDLLKTLVSKTRLENKLKYQKKILSIVEDDKARKELSEIVKKEEASLAKLNTDIENAQEKADEKGKDDPKYQEAKKVAKKEELANSSKDTEKRGRKDIDTSEIQGRDEKSKIMQYKLKLAKEKQLAISTAWQKKQDEIAETEDEDKKASLQKAADAIEKNLISIKDAIVKYEKGEDVKKESTDTEIWTIMAMINLVEQQIENYNNEFIPLNG